MQYEYWIQLLIGVGFSSEQPQLWTVLRNQTLTPQIKRSKSVHPVGATTVNWLKPDQMADTTNTNQWLRRHWKGSHLFNKSEDWIMLHLGKNSGTQKPHAIRYQYVYIIFHQAHARTLSINIGDTSDVPLLWGELLH